MRRVRLSTLLIGMNVGLLLFAVAGVAFVAIRLLRQLADEQALARVGQAGAVARQAVMRSSDEEVIAAALLAERPTLQRHVLANDRLALKAFLEQFQRTSQVDACVVIRDGRVVAQGGLTLPWLMLWGEQHGDTADFLRTQGAGAPLILGAWARIPGVPDAAVMTAQVLDARFVAHLRAQIESPVRILDRQFVLDGRNEPRGTVRYRALAGDSAVMQRLDDPALYLAALPLHAPAGGVVGVIEAELPADGIATSLRQLVQTLLVLALLLGVIAALVSFVIGRRFVVPLHMLTNAAARIGSGDLTTPIQPSPGAEIGTLAATLEEMRRRLMRLTADLHRQQAEAHAIVTGIVEGVFTVDRRRHIRYLNPQAAALFGVLPEQAIGRFCGDVLNPQGPNGVRPCEEHCPIVHARFRDGARATEHLLLGNGQRRTVLITSAPPNAQQQVQVLRDETEVEAVRRLRDAILANISHEFKTPLSAQLASIELLLDQLPELSTHEIGQLVFSLQRGTLRLTQLIDNLLESVRIEAGKAMIRRQMVLLDEVVEEALALTHPLIEQRHQHIAIELPYPLPPICGDAARLTQVFVNVLANANKFAPADTTIRISATLDTTTITIWIADQGPGLPPLAGQTLFERFVRAPLDEPEPSGMGLGLWIVKSIVERHGGRVQAQSSAEGTRMGVTLPLEDSDENTRRR